jgi:hypothetical protein
MGQLDSENIQVLKEIRNLGRIIVRATKTIGEQQEIRKDAKEEFQELLLSYPHARYVYYHGDIDDQEESQAKEK